MDQIDEERAAATRSTMARLLHDGGAVRDLALASGISETTIRSIATTGVISSMHTAAALASATDGAITVEANMQPGARGENVYAEFPGDALLRLAVSRRRTPGDLLASVGITQQDLNVFMSRSTPPNRVTERVVAAFGVLGIEVRRTDR